MELKNALDQLKDLQMKQYAYGCAEAALYLDGVTVAPRDTSEGRGVALGILAGESHKLFSDPKVDAFSLEVLGTPALRVREDLGRRIERFISGGYCNYDHSEAFDSLSARVIGDISSLCELCVDASRKKYAKALEKKEFICYN